MGFPYPGRRFACPGLICYAPTGHGGNACVPKGQSHTSPGQSAAPPWDSLRAGERTPCKGNAHPRRESRRLRREIGGITQAILRNTSSTSIRNLRSLIPGSGWALNKFTPGRRCALPRADLLCPYGAGGYRLRPEGTTTHQPRAERSAALGIKTRRRPHAL